MTEVAPATISVRSVAEIATPNAGRYLQQLCKHFQHKLPVASDNQAGEITFSAGICRIDADDALLTLSLTAGDEAQMAQLQDAVARHLLRFAFREELSIEWRPA